MSRWQWLSLILMAGFWTSLDTRGLASDFKSGVRGEYDSRSPAVGTEDKEFSDKGSDIQTESQDMRFIFQFLLGNASSQFGEEDPSIDTQDTETIKDEPLLLQDQSLLPSIPEERSQERQNKIYWTDEELRTVGGRQNNAEVNATHSVTDDTVMKIVDFSRAGRMKSALHDKQQAVSASDQLKDTLGGNIAMNERPAQDRQQVIPIGDLSRENIEEMFQVIVFSLPNLIDKTKDVIVADIATKNLFGYTIALSYFVGALFDTIGELVVNERLLADLITDLELWFIIGWAWFYAAGFAGPWMFPSTFGGDPHLGCSSMDYFSMLADSDLSLNIATITSRPVGEMSVLTARLRTDFNSKLGCIVHKKGKYKEATQVHAEFEKMLGLITFHHLLSSPVPGQADLLALDQELGRIWIKIPLLVEEAHAAVTTRRANTAAIVFFVGLLNLLGAIFGNLMIIFPLLKNGDEVAGGIIPGPGGGII
eukprot:GFUD01042184.1.p1 GENE.GFUD01042184.1~~GFUD01042184.1.p1  ORF type:complete len:479 (+),score=92.59 GFUD01042184.1:52-1488(+)